MILKPLEVVRILTNWQALRTASNYPILSLRLVLHRKMVTKSHSKAAMKMWHILPFAKNLSKPRPITCASKARFVVLNYSSVASWCKLLVVPFGVAARSQLPKLDSSRIAGRLRDHATKLQSGSRRLARRADRRRAVHDASRRVRLTSRRLA